MANGELENLVDDCQNMQIGGPQDSKLWFEDLGLSPKQIQKLGALNPDKQHKQLSAQPKEKDTKQQLLAKLAKVAPNDLPIYQSMLARSNPSDWIKYQNRFMDRALEKGRVNDEEREIALIEAIPLAGGDMSTRPRSRGNTLVSEFAEKLFLSLRFPLMKEIERTPELMTARARVLRISDDGLTGPEIQAAICKLLSPRRR